MSLKKELKLKIILKKMKLTLYLYNPRPNCFYRSISFFLLGSEEYYINIISLIIQWIENNSRNSRNFLVMMTIKI